MASHMPNIAMGLTVNSSSFDRKMKNSKKQVSMFAGEMSKLRNLLIGVGGVYGIKRAFTAVTTAAMNQEKAEKSLVAALKMTGDATKRNIKDLKDYAAALQKQTIHGDEAIITQMAYLKNMGMATNQIQDATKAAIGLSATYNKDLATSMRLIALASKGETGQLKEMGIVLDQTKSKQQQFNQLLGIGKQGFSIAQAETNTASGAISQFKNALGDLNEEIGNRFLPGITRAVKELTALMQTKKRTDSEMRNLEISRLERSLATKTTTKTIPMSSFGGRQTITTGLSESEREKMEYQLFRLKAQRHADEAARMNNELLNPTRSDSITNQVEEINTVSTDYYNNMMKKEDALRLKRQQNIENYANITASTTMNMIRDSDNWQQHVINAVASVAEEYIRLALVKQFAGAFSSFGGGAGYSGMASTGPPGAAATYYHSGGIVGTDGVRANVNPAVFVGAPRFHNGLMSDEFPAILQRGERVIPKGGGGVTVNVTNTGTPQETTATMTPDGVINIVNQDMQANGRTARTVKTIAAGVR